MDGGLQITLDVGLDGISHGGFVTPNAAIRYGHIHGHNGRWARRHFLEQGKGTLLVTSCRSTIAEASLVLSALSLRELGIFDRANALNLPLQKFSAFCF